MNIKGLQSYQPNNQRESKKFTNLKMIKYKKMSKAHFTLHKQFFNILILAHSCD